MKSKKDKKTKKVGKRSVIPSFITKLYKILENQDYYSIIRWTDNGKAFVIKNITECIEKVLPTNFKHNNFASFVRQLNMYDFHKNRNSNNESTFFHIMFAKGQKHSLKLIKRKIKRSNSNAEHSEFEDIRKENKIHTKKCIEDIYLNLLKNLEEISDKQKHIEKKVSEIENTNNDIIIQNDKMSDGILEKESLTKNMEVLILFLIELIAGNKSNQLQNSFYKLANTLNNISSFVEKQPNISYNKLSPKLNDSDKADFLSQIIENMSEDVLELIAKKTLAKYNMNIEDFNSTMIKNLVSNEVEKTNYTFPHLIQLDNNSEKLSKQSYQNELSETNLSSPTSLLSPNDIIFNKSNILMSKRKREDLPEPEEGSGELKLNKKEKETFFDEVTQLTPCLISSPNLSPSTSKIVPENGSSFFNNTNLDKCNNENLCGFCLEYNDNKKIKYIGKIQ